ncbi:PREDICTED: ribonuclease P protein subunit p20 [Ceratosolen solmsi marchali]|uniref:Ribonuclease P protein subunit p20 n=1 Tax=Ceratosolen solmsi marchali TaxID=326594 RepID=A0AAJ6YDC9_9HYME|nr:PREDICTED: ribonuclease P protein subunit p20 [Ceratosolen solmsi marchali]
MENQKKKEKLINNFKKKNLNQSKKKLITSNDHILKKRKPLRFHKKKNDIYVNNKTNFKVYLKICEKYLHDSKEVTLHGLGATINRVCNLALYLKKIHCDTLDLDIKTSSINLVDDLEPNKDDADYKINQRLNSAIHIRVFPIELVKPLRIDN